MGGPEGVQYGGLDGVHMWIHGGVDGVQKGVQKGCYGDPDGGVLI